MEATVSDAFMVRRLGIESKKMPAADPEVHLAAKELVRDPEGYFDRRRESDLRQIRQIMRRRAEKLAQQAAEEARRRRRARLRKLFGWLASSD
jgi:hypothetical protein